MEAERFGNRQGDGAGITRRLSRFLRIGQGLPGGNAIEHDDSVSQVGRHDEVVLHHEGRLLSMEDVPADTKLAGAMATGRGGLNRRTS